MGQKVHPYGFRLGFTKPWKSRWFAERDYDKQLHEDVKLKTELKEKLKSGASAQLRSSVRATSCASSSRPRGLESLSVARARKSTS